MVQYNNADQLLRPGEIGLFIYTEGGALQINDDGTGSTGNWMIDPLRRVDFIFIYKRNQENGSMNELLIARCGDFEGPVSKRYKVNLRDVRLIGYTSVNWAEFASTQKNPIRYLSR